MGFHEPEPSIEKLRAVKPGALRAHATRKGWQNTGDYGTTSHVYSKQGMEFLIPHTTDIADYERSIWRAVDYLAKHEGGLNPYRLLNDLVLADRDVIVCDLVAQPLYKLEPDERSVNCFGMSRWEHVDAISWFQSLVNSPDSSNLSFDAKRSYYSGLLFCHEVTSLNVVAIQAASPVVQKDTESVPSVRQVSSCLHDNITAVRAALSKTKSLKTGDKERYGLRHKYAPVIAARETQGLLSSYCNAVAGLLAKADRLEFRFSWSYHLPRNETVIRFANEDVHLLLDISRELTYEAPETLAKTELW